MEGWSIKIVRMNLRTFSFFDNTSFNSIFLSFKIAWLIAFTSYCIGPTHAFAKIFNILSNFRTNLLRVDTSVLNENVIWTTLTFLNAFIIVCISTNITRTNDLEFSVLDISHIAVFFNTFWLWYSYFYFLKRFFFSFWNWWFI